VPAACVVLENVIAWELAAAFLEKFGGDSVEEIEANYFNYKAQIKRY
jgi:chorismate synthase